MKKIIGSMALIGLVGCSDVIETEYTNNDNNANVTFYVTSSENMEALDSAKLYLINEGVDFAFYTDSMGVVQKGGLALGDAYTFKVEKDGYATQTITVNIDNESGNADYAIAGDETMWVSMFKLGGKVSGQLYVEEDGVKVPAEGAVIRANISCGNCDVDYVETTTEADGTYTFENLPMNVNITFVAQPFTLNNVRYASREPGNSNGNLYRRDFQYNRWNLRECLSTSN